MDPNEFENVVATCGACGKTVSAPVIGSCEEVSPDSRISLFKCPHCSRVNLARQLYLPDPGILFGDMLDPVASRLWPSPDRQLSGATPANITKTYAEAQQCLRIGAYTAAALMARRTLEAIVKDLGGTGRDLQKRLDSLVANETLDARLAKWGHALRDVGNEAAHDVHRDVSRLDAEDVLTFSEALADYSYTYRSRFDEFIARRFF